MPGFLKPLVLMPSQIPMAELIGSLPDQEAKSFAAWVAQIADEANGKPIDWSTAWSDEDLADALGTC